MEAVRCCFRRGQLARLYTTRRKLLRVVHRLFLCTLLCPTTITVSIHGSPVHGTITHVASGSVYRFSRFSDRDRTSCSKPTSRRTSGNYVAPRLICPCIAHPTTCLHRRENGERDPLATSLLFDLFFSFFFSYTKANCQLDFHPAALRQQIKPLQNTPYHLVGSDHVPRTGWGPLPKLCVNSNLPCE